MTCRPGFVCGGLQLAHGLNPLKFFRGAIYPSLAAIFAAQYYGISMRRP